VTSTAVSLSSPIRLTVLSCAYNEESNISGFLSACLSSKGSNFDLSEVVVVASGCTDRTTNIVKQFALAHPKVRLIIQPERTGKVSALLEGLKSIQSDVVLVEGADTLPSPEAFNRIASCFQDPRVDLVGTHPVPVAESPTTVYEVSKVMWDLHDEISAMSLKIGEAYAFRAGGRLRLERCEDDDSFFSAIAHTGQVTSRYARDAIIWTRVPGNLHDLWSYRFRIARLIARRRRLNGLTPSTWEPALLLRVLARYVNDHPRRSLATVLAIGLEIAARISATFTVLLRRTPLDIWRPILSTKLKIPQTTFNSEGRVPARAASEKPAQL